MNPFTYTRAQTAADAVARVMQTQGAVYLGGGTNLIDLMKEGVAVTSKLVDVSKLDLKKIESTDAGGVKLGAEAKNTETANHKLVREQYPLLTQAILAGATMQIRNMATDGGNLLQRTRCPYFYDTATPCNKRAPGTGCGAMEGLNRTHAIFGWSDQCIAVHPSDMCVALAAYEAIVHVRGGENKTRTIKFDDFHRLPGNEPQKDNTLEPGELIEAIELPKSPFGREMPLLEGTRPRELRVRARQRRRRFGTRRQQHQAGPHRDGRRGAQAVACFRSREGAGRQTPRPRSRSPPLLRRR